MKKTIIIGMICFVIVGAGLTALAQTTLNNPPNIPSEPHPDDEATDIGLKTHLSWTGGDPDPGDKAVYDLYFGTESEPDLLASDLQMPNYYPGVLEEYTQYYWKVVARDESQLETSSPIWTFTTNDCDCNPRPSGNSGRAEGAQQARAGPENEGKSRYSQYRIGARAVQDRHRQISHDQRRT